MKRVSHGKTFERLEGELHSGKLRFRKSGFTGEELAALRHVMGSTRPNDRRRYLVKEMFNEVHQLKNKEWFE
jgi:hypothetical protein